MELNGKIAVVTGAASGMGLETVKALAGAGATVYGMDLRQEALDSALAGVEGAEGHAADVSDSAAVNRVFATVKDAHGKLDILVNAAGVSTPSREKQAWVDGINNEMIAAVKSGTPYRPVFLEEITDEDFSRVLDINLSGTFYTMRAAAPLLKAAGGGSVTNFSSVAGLLGIPMPSYYPASKAAVVGLTKSAAAELGPFGIRVNAIAPAGIDTPMLNASGQDHVDFLLSLQPLKRVADPAEVGQTVLFLASEAGKHYTGQTLSPSGGALMG
jgi:NAD(P)-dependent dehydrogenase (short-subunit alcohol dehydrogenase family)